MAIMNNAATNMAISFPLDIYSEEGLLDHTVVLALIP